MAKQRAMAKPGPKGGQGKPIKKAQKVSHAVLLSPCPR
jgi:hypothetical protein